MTAEGGLLVAVIAEESDALDIGGLSNVEEYVRAPLVDLVNSRDAPFREELERDIAEQAALDEE